MPRRLFGVVGAMQKDGDIQILSGCLLAVSEDEARGHHVKWMHEQKPGYVMSLCDAFIIDSDLVEQAAREFKSK